jgi:hypothetical protein
MRFRSGSRRNVLQMRVRVDMHDRDTTIGDHGQIKAVHAQVE